MHDIRDALWVADNTLGAMLIVPEPERGPIITRHLSLARQRLHSMIDDPAFGILDISEDLLALRRSLDTLSMIRLAQGSPADVEALPRWHHPVRGWIAPDQIIRMAAHTSLIGPLTY